MSLLSFDQIRFEILNRTGFLLRKVRSETAMFDGVANTSVGRISDGSQSFCAGRKPMRDAGAFGAGLISSRIASNTTLNWLSYLPATGTAAEPMTNATTNPLRQRPELTDSREAVCVVLDM